MYVLRPGERMVTSPLPAPVTADSRAVCTGTDGAGLSRSSPISTAAPSATAAAAATSPCCHRGQRRRWRVSGGSSGTAASGAPGGVTGPLSGRRVRTAAVTALCPSRGRDQLEAALVAGLEVLDDLGQPGAAQLTAQQRGQVDDDLVVHHGPPLPVVVPPGTTSRARSRVPSALVPRAILALTVPSGTASSREISRWVRSPK